MSERRFIGFDRELRLDWLEAVAARAAAGDSPFQIRPWLDEYLSDVLGGKGRSGNRGKTVTVLTRIWVNVPPHCRPLRSSALQILAAGDASDRLALHWAMACAVYPFFAEVAVVMGRLLALQGEVERAAVIRRIVEAWGDRPAVSRGCRAVWTSVVGWGVLSDGSKRGRYTARFPARLVSGPVRDFLARLSDADLTGRPIFPHLRTTLPMLLFPFDLGSGPSRLEAESSQQHVTPPARAQAPSPVRRTRQGASS
jgi:hypothetical protein